jgi:hypothetical protein
MKNRQMRNTNSKPRARIVAFLQKVFRITITILTLCIILVLLLHVHPIQNIAGRWLLNSAGRITQKHITCDSYRVSLLGRAEFHNISVRHHDRFGNDPLATIKNVSVTFDPFSLFSQQIHIRNVLIDTPVLNMVFSEDRHHNLQKDPFKKGPGITLRERAERIHTVFARIRPDHILVRNGAFTLDHKPSEFRLYAPSIHVNSTYSKHDDCLQVSAEGLCVKTTHPERLNTLTDIRLKAEVTENGVRHSLISVYSTSGKTLLTGSCTLQNFEQPRLALKGVLQTDLADVHNFFLLNTALKGDSVLFFSGSGPAVDLEISGRYTGHEIQFGQFKFADFSAPFQYRNREITVPHGHGNAYDGSFRGSAHINLDPKEKNLDISAEGDRLNVAVLTRDLAVPFQMETSSHVALNVRGSNFNADAITVTGNLKGFEKIPSTPLKSETWKPLELVASFEFKQGRFSIPDASFSHPDHKIILDSCVFSADRLDGSISGTTRNLSDLLVRVDRSVPLRIDIPEFSGGSSFAADLDGTTADYSIDADLFSEDIRYRSEHLGTVHVSVIADRHAIDVTRFAIDGADLTASGGITWKMPDPKTSDAITLNTAWIDVDHLNLQTLGSLYLKDQPVAGSAGGTVRICDTANPDPCISTAQITGFHMFDIPVEHVDITGRVTPSGIFETTFIARSGKSRLTGHLDLPFSGIPAVKIDARNIPFAFLPGLESLGVSGEFDVSTQSEPDSGDKTIAYRVSSTNPAIMNFAASPFEIEGVYHFGVTPRIIWNATWGGDLVRASGQCILTHPYAFIMETGTRKFPLSVISDRVNRDTDTPNPFKGSVSLEASLAGNLAEIDSLKGDIHLNEMAFEYLDMVHILDEPGTIHLANRILLFDPLSFRHPSLSLNIGGRIDTRGTLSLETSGNLSLNTLDSITAFFSDTRGNCRFQLMLNGPWSDPNYIGSVYVQEFFTYLPVFGSNLEDYHAEIRFNQKIGRIMYMEGLAGGSYFGGSGEFGMARYLPDLFDMKFSGNDIEFEYPKGFRSIGDIAVEITGNLPDVTIGGTIDLRQSQYASRINYKTMIVNESRAKLLFTERRKPVRPLDGTPLPFNPNFNLSIRAYDNIHINNNLARVEMNMKLDVTGNLQRPKVLGHIDVLRGDVTFLQRNFELLSASIDFADPLKIDPLIVLHASTTIDDHQVHLDISGNVYSDLNIRPSSTPPLSDIDLWNLLVIGKTRENMASSEDYLAGGVAYVTGSLQEQIEQRFEYWMGFDEFSIDPIMSTSRESPSARFTAKKRFGPDLSVLYSRSATSTEDLLLIEYQLSDNIFIIGHKKEDNSIGADIRYRWEFE